MSETKNSKTPQDLKVWIEAKKRYRLTQTHICMAMELGLNPRKLGSIAPNPHESWKSPMSEFTEEGVQESARLFEKHFGS